jgi:glyoxylase-like metal-dependent hydrolase (beta-lactamase superfamily II)/rhodanese-related sulfurtransferase
MKIEQFKDKGLAHYSYAILMEDRPHQQPEIILIDPSRNITPYLDFAGQNNARITAVIETHPHADFISGHLELFKTTGAPIYCSRLLGAAYPHHPFDEGDNITLGNIQLKAMNTPGHSPDSITILLQQDQKDIAVFTGDTLFIGDCGRPDLRENAGDLTAKREELAGRMYHSLRDKLMLLSDETVVYPAHGAGTLCGRSLSDASYSTIGEEKRSNWSLQEMSQEEFITALTADQPFIPAYFPYDVEMNKEGAENLSTALSKIAIGQPGRPDKDCYIIDTRPADDFKKGHWPGSINIQKDGKFETWLGSILSPGENFYLAAGDGDELKNILPRVATIGYEVFIDRAFITTDGDKATVGKETTEKLDLVSFRNHLSGYTILDIRNAEEVRNHPVFDNAINIPLPELRRRTRELPLDKPIVVHCAGGYRSAIGSSLLQNEIGHQTQVFDLGEAIKDFLPNHP